MMGIDLIKAERERQLAKWRTGHDDDHTDGALAVAAAQLLVWGTDEIVTDSAHDPDMWGLVIKHRNDRARQLEIAGALVAAEIDRLRRQ